MLRKDQNHIGCALRPFCRAACGGLFAALALLAGCSAQEDSAEKSARAAMTRLLTCTVEDAEELSAVLTGEATAETTEPGMTSSGDQLTAYAEERFGAVLSEDCLQQMLMNRSLFSAADLVQSSGEDVEPAFVRFDKREGEEELFDFTADLKAANEQDPLATATGNILMEQTEDGWKASSVTLTVTE